jgi:AmmeMemoRadiSam system protein B
MTANLTIRPSAIAGTWYPGSAPALQRTIESYLDAAPPVELPGSLMALISPHAGYQYSGPTAAYGYAQARAASDQFDRVVLLGPLHRLIRGSPIGSVMVPVEEAFRTPLGDVRANRAFIAALGKRIDLTPVRHDEEHSLEIQLPFLQVALGDFSLVPIMLGESIEDYAALPRLEALAATLAELADDRTLLVASTDLSHLENYTDVVRIDRRLVDLVDAFDVTGAGQALRAGRANACGAAGLYAVLRAAELRGARGAKVLSYTCSGDVTGDKRPGVYTVGYMSAAIHG